MTRPDSAEVLTHFARKLAMQEHWPPEITGSVTTLAAALLFLERPNSHQTFTCTDSATFISSSTLHIAATEMRYTEAKTLSPLTIHHTQTGTTENKLKTQR